MPGPLLLRMSLSPAQWLHACSSGRWAAGRQASVVGPAHGGDPPWRLRGTAKDFGTIPYSGLCPLLLSMNISHSLPRITVPLLSATIAALPAEVYASASPVGNAHRVVAVAGATWENTW